jgi:hypothetical protein
MGSTQSSAIATIKGLLAGDPTLTTILDVRNRGLFPARVIADENCM